LKLHTIVYWPNRHSNKARETIMNNVLANKTLLHCELPIYNLSELSIHRAASNLLTETDRERIKEHIEGHRQQLHDAFSGIKFLDSMDKSKQQTQTLPTSLSQLIIEYTMPADAYVEPT